MEIIANPNCSTIQMVVALKPLHGALRHPPGDRRARTRRSRGPARRGSTSSSRQTKAHVEGQDAPAPSKFAHPIAFNCLPQIDDFLPNGYTKEEMKMVLETRKIMGDDSIDVCPTCIRVPVLNSHSESILVETEQPITPEAAREVWASGRAWSWWTILPRNFTPCPLRAPTVTRCSSAGSARISITPTPCSSGASAITFARGPRPTPSRSPRNCSSSTPCGPDRNRRLPAVTSSQVRHRNGVEAGPRRRCGELDFPCAISSSC